jgi:hypothetical protein
VSARVTLAREGDRLEHKEVKEHPIDDVKGYVDQMVSGQVVAMEIVVEAETDVGQWPVAGKTSESAIEKLRKRNRLDGAKIVPDVDDIVHVKRGVQSMTVQDRPQEWEGQK